MASADDPQTGSRWAFPIREGLVCAQHYHAMGDAIWLYLYLHKHAGFRTGIMPHYNHADAAAELGAGLRTVKRYLEHLEGHHYVRVVRGYNHLRVEILRYQPLEVSPLPSTEVPEVASQSPREVPLLALHSAGAGERSARSGTGEVPDLALTVLHTVNYNGDVPAGLQAAATRSPSSTDSPQAGDVSAEAVAAAILTAQGRPATSQSAAPLMEAARILVVEPYAGRATLEQIRDCLAAMAKKPYFAGHLHRLTAKRLAEDLGPWLVAQTQVQAQAQRRQCACHAWLDEPGSIHTLHCMLSGPATSENYVDSAAKEVVYAEPRYVRDPYRAQLLSPEERQEVSRHG